MTTSETRTGAGTALTGTRGLIRLVLRRDRVLMPLWILFVPLFLIATASSYKGLLPTAASRQEFADVSAHSASFVALYGPLTGSSIGELTTWRAGFVPVLVGLFALLTVIRHTRTDEEAGRRDLIGATVVGRQAGLAAALTATLAAGLVLAGLAALAMISEGQPAAGSLAIGTQFAAACWVFAGIGAVAAQLTEGAGAARGIAVVVLGAAYLVRVVGDLSGLGSGAVSWLSWLSPIGWGHEIRPYGGNRWWVLLLPACLTAVLVGVAMALSARRDVGAGLVRPRPGPATAGSGLRSPLALAWRLHRSLLAGWVAGFAVVGVVLGGVAEGIGDVLKDNPRLQDVFTRIGGTAGLIDAYLASIMSILGLFAAAYAIQATLRLRSEETAQRAEPVLATAVGRAGWAGSHVAFSILGPTAAMLTAGLTTGLTHGLNTHDVGREVPRILTGALVQLPAVWVLAMIALALFGLLPRMAAALSWGALSVCWLIALLGAALQLNQWVLDVSPFTHVPRLPGGPAQAAPLVWLLVTAVALAVAGLVGLRRRDIPTA